MHPTYIISSRYHACGKTIVASDVYEGERAFYDALDSFDDESDVVEAIRLNVGGTWEDITDEAHEIIREAQEDARGMWEHYRTEAFCNALHGAR